MKLLVVRHGESEDDVINAYGGWADFPLTQKGEEQLNKTAEIVASLNMLFDKILTSPLVRARKSADIIANKLNIPIEIFEYIKERNTYGLLCGMIKTEAEAKYPWLVEAYTKGEYVDGSERDDDIKQRARRAYELIKKRSEKNLILVTHGNFLKAFIPEILPDKKLTKKEDGGFIFIDTDSLKILTSNGIDVS